MVPGGLGPRTSLLRYSRRSCGAVSYFSLGDSTELTRAPEEGESSAGGKASASDIARTGAQLLQRIASIAVAITTAGEPAKVPDAPSVNPSGGVIVLPCASRAVR